MSDALISQCRRSLESNKEDNSNNNNNNNNSAGTGSQFQTDARTPDGPQFGPGGAAQARHRAHLQTVASRAWLLKEAKRYAQRVRRFKRWLRGEPDIDPLSEAGCTANKTGSDQRRGRCWLTLRARWAFVRRFCTTPARPSGVKSIEASFRGVTS